MEESKFKISFLNSEEDVSLTRNVSAVFLIALQDNQIVAIRHHRGWDLPGGHIEEGESLLEALQREVKEEASMTFTNPIPFVEITSNSEDLKYKGKRMIGFTTKGFVFNDFIPAIDSEERRMMSIEDFLSLHQGDKTNMRLMIEGAVAVLGG